MKIQITTQLKSKATHQEVFALFDESLFRFLTKSGPVKVLRYDGEEVGAEIHLNILFPYKSLWVSKITDRKLGEKESYFIDEGIKLPFGIKKWKHIHKVRQNGPHTEIIDDISFSAGTLIMDWFWFVSFWPQFYARKKQYNQFIKQCLPHKS